MCCFKIEAKVIQQCIGKQMSIVRIYKSVQILCDTLPFQELEMCFFLIKSKFVA